MTTHGYKPNGDPLCRSIALELTLSLHSDRLLYCLDPSVLALFHPPTPCLSLRGYLHTFHPTKTVFVAGLWEMWSPRQELRINSRLSSPICCQRLLWIQFPQSLTVYHHQHGFSWRLVSEISVNEGTCKQQEKQWLCGTRQMWDCWNQLWWWYRKHTRSFSQNPTCSQVPSCPDFWQDTLYKIHILNISVSQWPFQTHIFKCMAAFHRNAALLTVNISENISPWGSLQYQTET